MAKNTTEQTDTSTNDTGSTQNTSRGDLRTPTKISPPIEPGTSTGTSTTKISPPIEPG